MTHEELLDKIDGWWLENDHDYQLVNALRAVVQLHKPYQFEDGINEYKPVCDHCQIGVVGDTYPCETIQAIEKELM